MASEDFNKSAWNISPENIDDYSFVRTEWQEAQRKEIEENNSCSPCIYVNPLFDQISAEHKAKREKMDHTYLIWANFPERKDSAEDNSEWLAAYDEWKASAFPDEVITQIVKTYSKEFNFLNACLMEHNGTLTIYMPESQMDALDEKIAKDYADTIKLGRNLKLSLSV